MKNLQKLATLAFAAMAAFAAYPGSSSTILIDGDELEPGDTLTFELDDEDFPEEIDGNEVLTEYLPTGISVEWTGKKFKTPKAGTPKIKKVDGDYEVVVKESGEDNPCSLKVSYKKKTGKVTGSFKVYTTYEKKGKPKLKKYSATFSGKLGEGGVRVTIKKVGSCYAYIQ